MGLAAMVLRCLPGLLWDRLAARAPRKSRDVPI